MKEDPVNKICVPRMMEHTYIPSTQEVQVEGCQLEASLGYIENFLERTPNQTKQTTKLKKNPSQEKYKKVYSHFHKRT